MILYRSGLPITMNEITGELSFHNGLRCDGFTKKKLAEMTGLYKNADGVDPNQLVYWAYRNIRFIKDESLYTGKDVRYDITVICPGIVNNEFHKTSGHFHDHIDRITHPYPEVYEVIQGEIVFVLGKSVDFHVSDCGNIAEVRILHVKAGESIIIPPYWAHGSVNPTKKISVFSNLAVASCPLNYDAIKSKQGLPVYILKDEDIFYAERNKRYRDIPEPLVTRPRENNALGVTFGFPCYTNFIRHPEKYNWLLHPEQYMDEMDAMSKQKQQI